MSTVVTSETPVDLTSLPAGVKMLLERVPQAYLRDLAADLAWAALAASRRPDALHLVISEWETTLDELQADAGRLSEVLQARDELRAGGGITLDELKAELDQEAR